MRWLRSSRGDTLVEVVIALAILSLVFAVAYNVANTSYETGEQARENTVAAELIQDQAEKLRVWRDTQVALNPLVAGSPTAAVITSTNFPPNEYLTVNSAATPSTLLWQPVAPGNCFGLLLACTLSVTNTVTTNPANSLLNIVESHIQVQWTSLIGQQSVSSGVYYYLTDTRQVTTCDNSVAGGCT